MDYHCHSGNPQAVTQDMSPTFPSRTMNWSDPSSNATVHRHGSVTSIVRSKASTNTSIKHLRETQQEVKGSNRNPRRKPFITDEIWGRWGVNAIDWNIALVEHWQPFDGSSLQVSSRRGGIVSGLTGGLATILDMLHYYLASEMKLGVHLAVLARTIKSALQTAKQKHVQETIDSIPATSSSSQILRLLKPCIGSSNSRKRSRPGLPQVVDAEGEVCTTTTEAQDRWIQ